MLNWRTVGCPSCHWRWKWLLRHIYHFADNDTNSRHAVHEGLRKGFELRNNIESRHSHLGPLSATSVEVEVLAMFWWLPNKYEVQNYYPDSINSYLGLNHFTLMDIWSNEQNYEQPTQFVSFPANRVVATLDISHYFACWQLVGVLSLRLHQCNHTSTLLLLGFFAFIYRHV